MKGIEPNLDHSKNFSLEEIKNFLSFFNLPKDIEILMTIQGGAKRKQKISLETFFQYIHDNQNKNNSSKIEEGVGGYLSKIQEKLLKYKLPDEWLKIVATTLQLSLTADQINRFDEDWYGQSVVSSKIQDDSKEVMKNLPIVENNVEREKIIDRLLSDPKFVHINASTYQGSEIKKLYIGGRFLDTWTNMGSIKDLGLEDLRIPDLRHSIDKRISKVVNNNEYHFQVFPVINKFEKYGNGYGIVIKIYDKGNREGAAGYFIIIPDDEITIVDSIKKDPKILIDIFERKFKEISPWAKHPKNILGLETYAKNGLQLTQTEFIVAENH